MARFKPSLVKLNNYLQHHYTGEKIRHSIRVKSRSRWVELSSSSNRLTIPSKIAGDAEGALQYALNRLTSGLEACYRYHDVSHTFEDVMPAALYLAGACGVSEDEKALLRIGVAFHDIGFIEGLKDHEKRGVSQASQILPKFNYSPTDIKVVTGLILATRMPQTPTNQLEQIIADADLDVLER